MGVIELEEILNKLKKNQNYIKVLKNDIDLLSSIDIKYTLNKVINFSKENNLDIVYSWAYAKLGKVYIEEGEYELADNIFEEVYKIFKRNKDIEGRIYVIAGFIATKFMTKKYNEAIMWGIKGIELSEKHNNLEQLVSIKNNMCNIYIEIEEYEKALKMLDEIEEFPWIGTKRNKVFLKLNRVFCEISVGNLEKASTILDSIEENVINSPNLQMKWFIQKVNLYIKSGLYEAAEKYLLKAEIICENESLVDFENELVSYYTDIYIHKEEYEKVVYMLREKENDIIKNNDLTYIKELYYKLSICYENLEYYKEAYYYLKKYNKIQKEMLEVKNYTSIKILDNYRNDMNSKSYKLLYEQNAHLLDFGKIITNNLKKDNIFDVIAQEIKKFLKYDYILISLYDEKIDNYKFELIMNNEESLILKNNIVSEDSLAKYSIKNKEVILSNDIINEHGKFIVNNDKYLEFGVENKFSDKDNKFINSLIIIPMIVKDKVIGSISIQKYEKGFYELKDLVTFKILATYISIALDNSLLYKKVEYNSEYDALTNIYNRGKVLNEVRYIRELIQCNDTENYYIAMLDIDNFKSINDRFGHSTGDLVLKIVAREIRDTINEEDILGRYGGEEFIVLVKDRSKEGYMNIIEQIRSNVENLLIEDENKNNIKVTVSIGVEKLNIYSKTLEENISLADKKLYIAKNTGKNKVIF